MIYIFGILCIAGGTLMTIKAEWLLRNAGRNAWAEKYLGTEGGTRLFYQLLGIGFIIIGFMLITGIFGDIIRSIFSINTPIT